MRGISPKCKTDRRNYSLSRIWKRLHHADTWNKKDGFYLMKFYEKFTTRSNELKAYFVWDLTRSGRNYPEMSRVLTNRYLPFARKL